jgi:hypothetical protein
MDNDINEYPDTYDKFIALRKDIFIDSILETLHKDEKIIKQFLLDLPRTNVIINNTIMKNVDDIFNILKPYNRTIILDRPKRYSMYLSLLVFLIICQSSFFIQYSHLYKKMGKCKMLYPEKYRDIEVVDNKERNKISFTITKNSVTFEISGSFMEINIITEQKIRIIRPKIIMDIDREYGILFYL